MNIDRILFEWFIPMIVKGIAEYLTTCLGNFLTGNGWTIVQPGSV